MNYKHFQKPSRYINSEINSIHKKTPVRVALAFPDVYEIGMSHLGMKVLYQIINNLPFASAERVFAPWSDLEEALKSLGMLLTSLESKQPLREFDIIGFSLQYELSYTTVLNMLHMGGIPIKREERMSLAGTPLVIAGGPCTVNPLPMAAFIDAFLIGDGEEAVPEILSAYHRWKEGGSDNKTSLLQSLSKIEGVYVPALGKEKPVSRRYITSLEEAPFPDSPVLPFMNIVHDRINIEISRGCTMGCRFCQAGMTYRPVRERSPEKIMELAEKSLANTGYDALSFTSLSSGDYSCLNYLMKEFNRKFYNKRISLSLPSLRVGSVNREMLEEIKVVRKSGFTIAPEAGTDRLRAVINKDFTEETYINALETLFSAGWHNLKLYFMSGLPTETDEDIEAIPEMVMKATKISRK
ncbi:MAG: TIGR03960 family B12-binding radical SAM protein, partial [Thermodesulfovibrionales bacterium]